MSAANFPDYARDIADHLNGLLKAGQVLQVTTEVDQRSLLRGYIGGKVAFDDGSELHFREFVDVTQPEPRLAYAYHYQDDAKRLIFRYDNAAHRPPLPKPEHKHTAAGPIPSTAPALKEVLDEILGV